MVTIVTGSSRGIGRAIVERLASGRNVVVNYRSNEAAAREVVEQVEAAGSSALAIEADVGNPEAAEALVTQAREEFGQIDAVVNNAGIVRPERLEDLDPGTFLDVLQTNLVGAFTVTRAAAPDLRETAGDAIMVSSIGGTAGTVDPAYAASKAGLHGLTRALARELGDDGVQVNAVAPGPVETDLNDDIVDYLESVDFQGHEEIDTHLPQYACQPDDVAHAVEFLLENPYVQGEILSVNGGMQFR
ncbi:SDR family NAD(P)-dependent oxidoreductase [Natrarchaeobaculum aegyptiacum]|uniref:Short-chain dehydrogenase n=1 Tax=Natrarchaeobaculum aegyptiacum TaxID=745377 RepID=A0A2Z2HNF8_9EURY|nr:SDR family oxidoreductase [Natrarchaeobaculum aegyptiacum]ARS88421.1 short-chain dehydrogenase [Natrarchaeobaculum aegyptiacum]